MHHYFIIPAISTLAGFLIAYFLRTSIIKKLPGILQNLSRDVFPELFPVRDIRSKINSSSSFQNIQPVIEGHIDEFLRNKLGKEMPMIGMFIGDKTIAQLKGIFMKELEEIFPLVMNKYISDLSSNFNPEEMINQKMASISREKLSFLLNSFIPTFRRLLFYGALAGFATGMLQLIALWLTSQF